MKKIIIICGLFIFQPVLGFEKNPLKNLEKISEKMKMSLGVDFRGVSQEAVIISLYEQIRPKVRVTKQNLTDNEIDHKVKEYISSGYYPALVKSYIIVYKKMLEAKIKISYCKQASYFEMSKNIQATLCLKKVNAQKNEVFYNTIFGKNKSKINASFIFNTKNLIGINLHKKDDVLFTIANL